MSSKEFLDESYCNKKGKNVGLRTIWFNGRKKGVSYAKKEFDKYIVAKLSDRILKENPTMNHATKTTHGDSALHYKDFPSIKVGHFYKMECKKDVRVVAYCASVDQFIVKTGSTFGLDDYPELARDDTRPWIHVVNDWEANDYIEAQDEHRAVFKADYDKGNPLEVAQALTIWNDVNPAEMWVEVFDYKGHQSQS